MALSSLNERLAAFLANNPSSNIVEAESPSKPGSIRNPWGDDSLYLDVPDDRDFIDDLNNIVLPHRFSAIWHIDTKRFEILYTAYKLSEELKDVTTRRFEFDFRQNVYSCGFARSSERSLRLARNFKPTGPSAENYRNLFSYRAFNMAKESDKHRFNEPISFWIDGIEWDDDFVVDLSSSLNFYMRYFDSLSPIILLHAPATDITKDAPIPRFTNGAFPAKIKSVDIDDSVLNLWHASITGDPIRKFLYNYQILEYVAYYYIEENVRRNMKRTLLAPQALSNIDNCISEFLGLAGDLKMYDGSKIDALLTACVKPEVLLRSMAPYISAFTKETVFQGGLTIAPILKPGAKESDLTASWLAQFGKAIRSIRNALSHGKEQRMSAVISPTGENFNRLRPWVSPISAAVGEVLVYRNSV